MIGRLNHVAIATSDMDKAISVYRDMLGANVSAPVPQPDHGVVTVFVVMLVGAVLALLVILPMLQHQLVALMNAIPAAQKPIISDERPA